MNRTIKFRAWDCGVMVKPFGLLLRDSPYILETLTSEATLMQFTGLKDKNGKEIYEGDIVQFDRNNPHVNPKVTVKVHFKSGAFYAGSEIDILLSQVFHVVEIVGNIYENPELLKP